MERRPSVLTLSWTSLVLTKLFRNYSLLSNSFDSEKVRVDDMTKARKTRIGPEQLRGNSSSGSFYNEEDLHDSVSIRSLTSVDTVSGAL